MNIRLWATWSRHVGYRFVVIDKDLHHSGWVTIKTPHLRRAGVLTRLLAPNVHSIHATLAGQSFPSPTYDARIHGKFVRLIVPPHAGDYRFWMPRHPRLSVR